MISKPVDHVLYSLFFSEKELQKRSRLQRKRMSKDGEKYFEEKEEEIEPQIDEDDEDSEYQPSENTPDTTPGSYYLSLFPP